MKGLLKAGLVALALAAGGAARAQVVLTPDQMRAAAMAALQAGDLPAATQFAQALLLRDPADGLGLAVLAHAGMAAGDPRAARAAALALWRSATDPATRHDAARLIALADAQAGHPLLAQLWLRRAMTVAPDREALRQTVADFRALRAASPLSLSFGLSATPSANATGGTDVDVIAVNGEEVCLEVGGTCVFPLSPAPIDRAWSGLAYAANLQLTWHAAWDDRSNTDLWLMAQGRGVVLSDAAQAALDGEELDGEQITARHFAQMQAMVGVDHRRAAAGGVQNWTGFIGRTWPRGEPGEDIVNIGYSRTLQFSDTQALVLGGSLEWRFDIDDPTRDTLRQTLRATHADETAGGHALRYDLTLTNAESDYYGNRFARVTTGVTLTPDSFLPGIDARARLTLSAALYPDYEFLDPVPGGRLDRQAALGLDLTFDRLSWAGFSPTMTVEAQRTDSNVNQFESAGVTVSFGVESTF